MILARTFAAAILGLALAQLASAQTRPNTPPAASHPSNTAGEQNGAQAQRESLPHELHQKLAEAGYTDINIKPRSFVVTAKTKDGNPVLMRISPNEMTVLTEAPGERTSASGNSPATTGSTTGSAGSSQK